MRITVLSGKGGTGKTTVAVNMALSLENVQLLDADVEEPDDYIFINPVFKENEPVFRKIPVVNENKCTACKQCVNFCQFNALALMLDRILVFDQICHSCGGCMEICPVDAITEQEREVGKISGCTSGKIEFWQGELNIGEEMAVPVIRELKKHIDDRKNVIIDAQPGTTCPTMEAALDSDYCLLVTEPTPFGLSDLKMAVEMLEELNLPYGVIINRSEEGYDYLIEEYCLQKGVSVLMKIPYNRRIAELYSEGIPFVNELPGWRYKFERLFARIREEIIQ